MTASSFLPPSVCLISSQVLSNYRKYLIVWSTGKTSNTRLMRGAQELWEHREQDLCCFAHSRRFSFQSEKSFPVAFNGVFWFPFVHSRAMGCYSPLKHSNKSGFILSWFWCFSFACASLVPGCFGPKKNSFRNRSHWRLLLLLRGAAAWWVWNAFKWQIVLRLNFHFMLINPKMIVILSPTRATLWRKFILWPEKEGFYQKW